MVAVPPASVTARHGSVSSLSSKPSVARKATFASEMLVIMRPFDRGWWCHSATGRRILGRGWRGAATRDTPAGAYAGRMSVSSHPLPATIAHAVEHELVIRKSRFLTLVAPVDAPEAADAVIADVRRRYWDARHNCSAQVTGLHGDRARSSDDGEPSGTAGIPMLEVLRRRELTDV